MSLFNVFEISSTALSAQSMRLNSVASNLANAGVVSGSEEGAYRARQPVFSSVYDATREATHRFGGVRVDGIVESDMAPRKEYSPGHPMADDAGYIYRPNVNPAEEMANMISASRAYQTNVQVADASKQMLMRTLQMGQ